jgi:hypothetical protein
MSKILDRMGAPTEKLGDSTAQFNLLAMPRGNYEITAQLSGFVTQPATAEQLREVVDVSAHGGLGGSQKRDHVRPG